MWLPIIIIGLAAAMVIGPIMLLQPNQSQRRTVSRRNRALQRGLRVHLQPVPEGSRRAGERKQVAMYCLPWKDADFPRGNWLLIRRDYAHDIHFCGEWDWQREAASPLLASLLTAKRLSELSDDVLAVASGPQGLCCYWLERGTDEQVDALADWLTALMDEFLAASLAQPSNS